MGVIEKAAAEGREELTEAESKKYLATEVRRYLGMSLDEFYKRAREWHASGASRGGAPNLADWCPPLLVLSDALLIAIRRGPTFRLGIGFASTSSNR